MEVYAFLSSFVQRTLNAQLLPLVLHPPLPPCRGFESGGTAVYEERCTLHTPGGLSGRQGSQGAEMDEGRAAVPAVGGCTQQVEQKVALGGSQHRSAGRPALFATHQDAKLMGGSRPRRQLAGWRARASPKLARPPERHSSSQPASIDLP